MRTVSAAEANRQFSKILRAAVAGETIIVTSRGKPVAQIRALGPPSDEEKKDENWRAFLDRLSRQPAQNLGRFKREDAYE